ncbi:MAG: hypothetical protein A2V93_03925 [Ignavibacteria bacterium RBG_16_34_14]|nr:MAG: hypothetical protein A2V93_03925 [Ignavibacteria bacterium RBG_16_34_14]
MLDNIPEIIQKIILAFLTLGVGYWLGQRKIRKQEFFRDCKEFREAFSDIVYWLENNVSINSGEVLAQLQRNSQRYEEAIIKFGMNFKPRKKMEFDRVCERFFNKKNNHNYHGYIDLGNSAGKVVLENINELLKFAKY